MNSSTPETGALVWITGLPSSGKSTFAEQALIALRERTRGVCVLDGDSVRSSLVPAPGYSTEAREHFYETLARLAALLTRQGLIVLVPATAHRRAYRDFARSLVPAFLEVWVATPRAECEKRDTKGLYAASRSGSVQTLPGAGEPYEPPARADVIAEAGRDDRAVAALCAELERAGLLRAR
jgi:adenylylsulfate kinase